MNELSVEARIENMDAVQGFISARLEDCPIKVQTQIAIAVDEIFSNIANYAYNPEIGSVVIHATVGDEIVIAFEDKGKPYNPLEKDDPNITLGAEEREIGGLGIFMVKKIMDSVEYRHEGNKNILSIRKKIT